MRRALDVYTSRKRRNADLSLDHALGVGRSRAPAQRKRRRVAS